MSEQQTPAAAPARAGRDWRVYLGLGATALWLALGAAYVSESVGWADFAHRPASELGEFLDGAFAPLAFLWLVLGLFMQQTELAENNRAIARQHDVMHHAAQQAEIQARAIAANELHARQDTFIELAKLVGRQLDVIAGFLFMSSQGVAGSGAVIGDDMDRLWSRMASGESALFCRRLIALRYASDDEHEAWALFWSTPVRTRHSEGYLASFDRLVRTAAGCDPEGMIVDALHGDAQGRLARIMRELAPLAPAVRD